MSAQNPISDEELLEIQRRVEATTPGPWHTSPNNREHLALVFKDGISIAQAFSRERGMSAVANAEFTAHARTDVPRLLTEIKRLKAELEETNNLLKDEMGIG